MAVMKVCAVYDVKAESYNMPMTFQSLGVAIRDFQDAFSNKDNKMSPHRDDFSLYHIGDYDTVSALVEPVNPPKLVFKGSDIGGE